MEDKKYRIFVEDDNGSVKCQGKNKNWYKINEKVDWNLYNEYEACKFCQEANTTIYSLHKGFHYFYKEYKEN